jgi:hypothetical protein
MFKTNNFTNAESISLMAEIAKVGTLTDTPLVSLLLASGNVGTANSKVQTWRESTYNTTDIGSGVVEGNENPSFYESGRAELSNVLQIIQRGVSVSGTANAINVAGQGDVFSAEVADRLVEVKAGLEKAITVGQKNDGSTSPFIRTMQGLENWVDAENVVNGATVDEITEDEVKATVRKLWEKGVSGTFFALVNADMKEAVDAIYADKYSYIANHDVFGLIVSGIQTNYGVVYFLLSRYASPEKMTVFDVNALSIDFLRQPQFEALAKIGDSVRGQVITEATLRVKTPKAVAQYIMASA